MSKKTKNKSVFTTKQKILMIIGILVILVTIIVIALNPTGKKRGFGENMVVEENDEFKSIKEVIEYFESEYYSSEISTEEGYDLDIKVSFKYNLYEGDESKETFFKNLYERIAIVTDKKSFRIIDESKNITIAIKCTSNGIYEVKINGETDFYRREDSKRSLKKNFKAEILNLSIDSPELKSLIDANWITKNADLGTVESSYYKYDVYFDEGYEIKTLQGKVYNIVFTKNYDGTVIDGFNVGANLKNVQANYGTTFEENGLLGYKTKDFYIWFSDDEISIYPITRIDYSEFEKLAKEYNENKNANDFMYKITDIWTDYDLYEYNENYVKISYANKGVQFQFSVEKPVGITLFENYKGELRNKIEDYPNIYYSFDKTLTGEREVERRDTKIFYDDCDYEDDPIHNSKEFQIICTVEGNEYKKVKIKSLNDKYPNNELDEYISINSYVWGDDTHLIYGVTNDGIYLYDAINRTIEKVTEGNEKFQITDYNRETNLLTYDNTGIKFDF